MKLKLLGIIGDPIAHSLSPAMQNAALQKAGIHAAYLPFRVKPKDLGSFLRQIRKWPLWGFNVTIPHKERILEHLHSLSPAARVIGAVNTVIVRNGRLTGDNTDHSGYLHSLQEEMRWNPRGKTVLILGAGGAARAVFFALSKSGARKIFVANRTPKRAAGLSSHSLPLRPASLKKIFPEIDLLVNTTSVGLNGSRFKGLPFSSLRKGTIVSDLVYRPLMTPLLKEAKRRGLRIHLGTGMLLHQGAESFRLWTEKKPNLKVMRKALRDALS